MKNLFIALFLACSFLSSCSSEDPTYSCNKEVDHWVKENLADIRTMTRAEWSNIDENMKVPVYRAFTHEQKVNFWIEKFTDVLALNWTPAEKEHISSLISMIKEHSTVLDGYNNVSDTEKNQFDLFFYKWFEASRNTFKWSNNLIYAIVASGNTLLDKKGTLAISKNRATGIRNAESNCNCSLQSDWCLTSSCEDVTCDEVEGCGTMFVYTCTGRCGGI